jgi:predicted transcriptional regulator
MAMTVRLPEELDAKLEELARSRHTSKHAILIEAADRFVAQQTKTDRVLSAIDEIGQQYADAIKRLEDA